MLMIRGQAWRPMPKITVALDLESEDRALARAVLDTAECLALGCHGELSVVNCRGPETRCSKVDGRLSAYAQATLAWLGLAPGEVKQAEESPVAAFRVGGAHSGMDVLVLGGVRPSAWEQGTPTMTEALLTSLENDVLLVPRTRYSGLH